MWHSKFEQRLNSWHELRTIAASAEPLQSLQLINDWWHCSPWTPYYLHWDDIDDWPNPWQLLEDNIYCPVAKSLGILYTITIIDHSELQDAALVLAESGDSLVLVKDSQYILGLEKEVNQITAPIEITKSLSQFSLRKKY